MASGAEQVELVCKRKFPVVGDGSGVWSFIHVADAADATVAAIERGSRGVYNVVDDDPAAVAEWLPALAEELGAKKPMRVPRFVGRLFAGKAGVEMMTELRGASNGSRSTSWGGSQRTGAGGKDSRLHRLPITLEHLSRPAVRSPPSVDPRLGVIDHRAACDIPQSNPAVLAAADLNLS